MPLKKAAKITKKTIKIGLSVASNPRAAAKNIRFHYDVATINRYRYKSYKNWFDEYYNSINDAGSQKNNINKLQKKPLISILLPIYNTDPGFLSECIESVIAQTYDRWELCVADDASTEDPLSVVKKYAKKHKNIKWVRCEKNQHIAGASNEALKLATGEYIALLDHDDLLTPNALFEVVKAINKYPDIGLIYSDEDKIDNKNRHVEPFFKPDWSPDFLYSCNYITHFAVVEKGIMKKINGFRIGTEGAQDWDLFLRATKETKNIYHIPKILYHWRKSETSTAHSANTKPYAYINQLRVLRDAMFTEKETATVHETMYRGFWRVRYPIQGTPLVSVIIPTKNNLKLIKGCLESIIELTTYPRFEVIVVDTGSSDEKVLNLYKTKFVTSNNIRIVSWKKPFNFSEACNFGVSKSTGEYLLFLNNDTEVITPEWIDNMIEQAQRKDVGMVGCKLLFPNEHIQHAGVVVCEKDIAFHPFYNTYPKEDIFTNIYISNIRNVSAVTAACSMVSRKKFDEVEGFDPILRVTYNDVDLCLKLIRAGYRNIYTPYSELYHHESMSVGRITGKERDNKELKDASNEMRKRWGDVLKRDPYYNDNFEQHGPGYRLV